MAQEARRQDSGAMGEANGSNPALLLLCGRPAVGKTTVGQELESVTGFRLFHIHQVVDLITQYFPYSTSPTSPYYRLVVGYRTQFFEEAANSGLRIITTTGWQFDRREEDDSIRGFIQPFLDRGGKVYLVELVASLETRLGRNVTENRRSLKRVDWSTEVYLRRDAELHPYRSDTILPFDVPHLRLETDQLSAEAAAERIREHFGLTKVGSA